MRSERGLSLIEATIVLMVLSVIASIMAPPVLEYIRTTEQAAATHDAAQIGTALSRMLDDVRAKSIWLPPGALIRMSLGLR